MDTFTCRKTPPRSLLVVLLLVATSCASAKKITKLEKPKQSTEKVFVVSIELVRAAVEKTFSTRALAASEGPDLSKLQLYRYGEPGFPPDSALERAPEDNPRLRSYGSLSATERSYDYYAVDVSGDYYWESEYLWDGKPAKFTSKFIIHLSPVGATESHVEVIELGPQIWIGDRLRLGHNSPGYYNDIRNVAPTNRDPALILEAIFKTIQKINE